MATSRSPGSASVMFTPSSSTRPAFTASSPARMRSVVVLPEPDGPKSAKNSPGAMSRSTPCSAVNAPWRLTTPLRETKAVLIAVRRL